MFTRAERDALEAAKAQRRLIEEMLDADEIRREMPDGVIASPADIADTQPFLPGYDAYESGRFEGLDSLRLKWAGSDWFQVLPDKEEPFAFIRPTGERVEPGVFFTDGGSIPSFLRISLTFSPWAYGPAFILHDWSFHRHLAGMADGSFEDANDTMMEAMKTLVEMELAPDSEFTFRLINWGINSPWARRIWDNGPSNPPDPSIRAKGVTSPPSSRPPPQP